LNAFVVLLLIALSLLGRIPAFGFWLVLPASYLLVFLVLFEKKYALPGGIYFEALVESTFVLTGVLALVVP
jgi:hypothetical protein